MLKRKSKNIISFTCDPEWEGVYPKPIPAIKGMPEYFKNMGQFMDPHDPQSSSVKRCMPFIDALSAGYILPLWADLNVRAFGADFTAEFPKHMPMNSSISGHPREQIGEHPFTDSPLSASATKLHSPWVITTPKGWSCYFVPCLNHMERRFQPIAASVDTDTYYNEINFPFIWTGGEGNFVIKRGTPFLQVIPYRREKLPLEIGITDTKKRDGVYKRLGTYLHGAYRANYWHKRKSGAEDF
jgi:hypothetical protein